VALDKPSLLSQMHAEANEPLALCPCFERSEIERRIRDLPEKLDPKSDGGRWAFGYSVTAREREKPVWVFPRNIRRLPYDVALEPRDERLNKVWNATLQAVGARMGAESSTPARPDARKIPAARYGDVCGQDAAVEAVRDYAETPLKHPELFERLGVRPGRGILLWGPPGTGKTLLARAAAGETDAHIETICGPEVLSKWVGEAERRIREIFERAQRYAPAVVLIDEIDAIAGARDASDSHHLREAVSQLLVLLDGLRDRGRVLVIATTNRPDAVDPAILRPGRIDRKVFMGPPSFAGRLAHIKSLLARTPTAPDVSAADLARRTRGFTGAEIEHLVNEAGLAAIKEAVAKKLGITQQAVSVGLRQAHWKDVERAERLVDQALESKEQNKTESLYSQIQTTKLVRTDEVE
jgi:transitional endoplasmic reticulum ATPase